VAKNKLPKIIVHDSISLDGSFVNFEFSMELMGLHYQIASRFRSEMSIMGSTTAAKSIEMFGGFTPETKSDFNKPEKKEGQTYWVIPDSKGTLKGKLHFFRRSEYCKDVIVLVSEKTDKAYIKYLKERNYDFLVSGTDRVDLRSAISMLSEKYGPDTIMIDSGRSLTNAFINDGLVDEISVLIVPTVVGENARNLFSEIKKNTDLKLIETESFGNGFVWIRYSVVKKY